MFKMPHRVWGLLLVTASVLLYSCQKVINIDLNSASPQLVVQGNISNQPGNYTVQLTQTVNFNQTNIFPAVSGAFVTIADNLGHTDTLKEEPVGSGIYKGNKLTGTPGNTYVLSITANGKNYIAASTMPSPVNIDTLELGRGPFRRDTVINVLFQDPPGTATHNYHLVEFINDTAQTAIYVTNDEFQNGQLLTFPIALNKDSVKAGDTVTIDLQSIDANVFNYYNTLEDANGAGFNTAPSNPQSNINNGALGYFSAYAVTGKEIIIP